MVMVQASFLGFSKLISKVLANRLERILPLLNDLEQFGFVQGRNIHDIYCHGPRDLDKKVEGGNIMFKLDMSTAYDRL